MTRTSRYKLCYFSIGAGGTLAIALSIWYFKPSPLLAGSLILLLFLPGRILGYFWRDLLRGLRLLHAREFEKSRQHSAAFLDQVAAKPWLKHLIWLGSSTYSRDPEALALNNLGAAEIQLGHDTAARIHLEASIAVDPDNPLPYVNLAVLARLLGNAPEAESFMAEAKYRGYTGGRSDTLMKLAQKRFAATDG